jgi:hypothetical protein
MQPGCSPPSVVIQKDDYQPYGGEKQAGLRPPSCPQLQGCSSSVLGEGVPSWGPASAWAGGSLLPSILEGEGRSPSMQRRQTSGTRGWPTAGAARHRVLDALAWMALAPPSTLPPAVGSGRGCPFTTWAVVAPCAGPPHPRLLPHRRLYWWFLHGVIRRGGSGRVLGCPHSFSKDKSEDLQAH